jgi:hypothetical protein
VSSALGADRYCRYFPRSRFLPPKDHVEMTDAYVNAKYAGETVVVGTVGRYLPRAQPPPGLSDTAPQIPISTHHPTPA